MEQRVFGATGRPVAAIGQGTWEIDLAQRSSAVAALQRGIDLGMTHLDTAEMYGSGLAEEVVAQGISGRRQQIFLVSKVLPQNASRRGTREACERSLARLGTDYLDCYLLHWRGSHPLAETIGALQQLQQDGKISSWGVSNFDEADLTEALALAGPGQIACNQVLYHLEQRGIEHGVIPWCQQHGVAVVAYSPFGQGRFVSPGTPRGKVLAEIAATHGVSAYQVALRFLLRVPGLFVIPKAARLSHVADNAGADAWRLSEQELARIEEAFPRGPRPAVLPTL